MRTRGRSAIGRMGELPGRRLEASYPDDGPIQPIDAGGSNDGFTGPIVPLTGAFASAVGGYIDSWNAAGVQVSLDVANWRVRRIFERQPLCCSGNLGCTDSRQIGYSYLWQADILWDFRRPADTMNALRWPNGLELVFWLGNILYQQMQASQSPGSTGIQYPYLWCPDAVLEVGETMLDAIAKKMTRVPCQGRTRSHVFVCPVEGIPSDASTVAGAYSKWYSKIGPENKNANAGG